MIGGVTKAGTTSLHYYLSQHPDIYMSEVKEPWFFVLHYDKGIAYYENTYFSGVKNEKVIGEATPGYLDIPNAKVRIKKYYPDMKFIFILRDPIDRAYSHWQMNRRNSYDSYPFLKAVNEAISLLPQTSDDLFTENRLKTFFDPNNLDKNNPARERYITSGFYAEQVKGFIDLFGEEQIKIFLFEDLKQNPTKLLSECIQFLGVDNSIADINLEKQNEHRRSLTGTVSQYIGNKNATKLVRMLPKNQLSFIRKMARPFMKVTKKEAMSEQERAILRDIYKQHNDELSKLIGRNLDHWNK